ncbi:TPA: NUDIX hydrolase [Vibrio parahaemolyticus]|nr:NUDIX hydrolase [Vibrio parahaemolyticus]HCE1609504.1 NUDIX hydrolase [Vibrio parahaemolyticus]HCE5232455.1 NUDIX hydrolase [Vibrio parahaemolyticus]HCG5110957.1 NUDIX hydrolase [Vibrio parahaemolyticus]HCG5121393.1 NUDIX hydrolase [Vibrio parahaemolyticus]
MKDLSMAVVVKRDKVLIQQRYRRNKGMVFEFPGGSVDRGESGEEAAIRELWEETGLSNLKLLGSHQFQNEFGGDIHYVVLAALDDSIPKITDENRQQTFYWFKPNEIPLVDFYRADVEFIGKYLAKYT